MIKIHKILKFKKSDWMKKYIDFNTKKRKKNAKKVKSLFKQMNNSVYGKKRKNLRKSVNVRLLNNAKEYLK